MSDEEKKQCRCPSGMVEKDGKCVMPDVTFTSFFMALNSSALMHLGEMPDPVSGERRVDLMLAKHTIDTMRLIQEKTRGNLNDEERELVETSLFDLQLRYVKATS